MTVMPKFSGVVRNIDGRVVAGAPVVITNVGDTTRPFLYADDNTTVLTQPLTTDQFGRYEFSTNPGAYDHYVQMSRTLVQVYRQLTMGSPGGSGAVDSVNTRTGSVVLTATDIPVFLGSGGGHAAGAVPDPGSTDLHGQYFCNDKAMWVLPPVFIGGVGHRQGAVPDPGGGATGIRALFDDGTWKDPSSFASTYGWTLIQDQRAPNTPGGTFTSGAWIDRVLNTLVADTTGLVILAGNEFTLGAGNYLFEIDAPAYGVGVHRTQLLDVTNGIVVGLSTSEFAPAAGQTRSRLTARYSVATGLTAVFKLQHQCGTTVATNGLGVATNFGTAEVYTNLLIRTEPVLS